MIFSNQELEQIALSIHNSSNNSKEQRAEHVEQIRRSVYDIINRRCNRGFVPNVVENS